MEGNVAKILENLRWRPMWVSHLGCIKGCLDYLGFEVTDAWLYGATGHAFVMNMHDAVCPSGPTAWNTEKLFELGKNVGYVIDGVFALKSHDDFKEKQEKAWEHARKALDRGTPCYGWELDIPEYYVIYGYDDVGYHFSGPKCDAGRGPKPWQELGDTPIGCLELYSVAPGSKASEAQTMKDGLTFALEHAQSPENWIFPKYRAGLAGFDSWIEALKTGKADGFGMAYNSEVWSECRQYGVEFLREAKERGPDRLSPLFDESIKHYEAVSTNLKELSLLFPFETHSPRHVKDEKRKSAGLERLKRARNAEETGLKTLRKLVDEI
jgi:hypothetical protein